MVTFRRASAEGRRIDLLLQNKARVQACELLEDETTKAREVRALTAAMEETNVRHGRILTENYHEDIKVSVRTIHCVPAPYFLMEREFPSL